MVMDKDMEEMSSMKTKTSFYSEDELRTIGFKSLGHEVYVSKKCSIYSPENISIGSYVRIDDFCILSGSISIGSYVHIAAYSALYGGDGDGILICDFVTLSSRNVIYSATDDYYGNGLSNPLFPDKYRNIYEKKVVLEKHSLIGTGCTILPGAHILEGTSVGAMSMIKKEIGPWGVYAGNPPRKIGDRKRELLSLERIVIDDMKFGLRKRNVK